MSQDYYLSCLKEGINIYPYDSFSDIRLSGSGGFGNVYQAIYRDADMLVALKSNSNLKEIVNELRIQKTVDVHENIIRFLGVTKNEGDKYLLVLQWADGGTLRRIIHRDIHPNNILIHQENIKLADFGLSRWITANSRCDYGVLRYVDPQAFIKASRNYKLNKKSDVYSVGMLMWELSSGRIPFGSLDDLAIQREICFNGIREKIVEGTPISYLEIYQRCWQNDPDLRPTMDQIYDSLKKVDLNSPVFRITSSNISLPCTTVLPITDLLDIEICVNGFLTNIIHQNRDISIQYDDSALNSQANELWNILDNSTNIGKDFTQISKEIIEYHRQKQKDIKNIFDWLKRNSTNTTNHDSSLQCLLGFFYFMGIGTKKYNGVERATNRLKEMSSSSISRPMGLASFLVPTVSNN
ncbi:24916_t:CDS:2 [Dentiscutata erythropus]|uniref:24916_t:CDS:1 n=1 Tax=Dentiscutata erythropus TaxID=1348616 RepID=A0A9N8VJU4_9GLOM|nr:24916_t:CDS:2 [Dentiscutata erythropus]